MKIFIADINEIIKRRDFYESHVKDLSCLDFKRYTDIKNEKRRLQFLTGRFLIKENIKGIFSVKKTGKLVSNQEFLSLTHTDDTVILAVSKEPVGIDTENILKVRNFESLSKHMGFSLTTDPDTFYRNFTAYEADYKLGKEHLPAHHFYFYHQNLIVCIATQNIIKKLDICDCIPFVLCNKIKKLEK